MQTTTFRSSAKWLTRLSWLAVAMGLGYGGSALAEPSSFDAQMAPILEQYLKIPTALAADHTKGVAAAAKKLGRLASQLKPEALEGPYAKQLKGVPEKLRTHAARLSGAKDIKAMRDALRELSKPMALWASLAKPKGVSVMYCSMARGSWLQRDTTIANPYYGASMLRCGEIVAGKGK